MNFNLPSDNISKHEIWSAIGAAEEWIGVAEKKEREIGPGTIEELIRLRSAVRFTNTRLKSADKLLLNPSVLDDATKALSEITEKLRIYWDSNEDSFITHASKHVDDLTRIIALVPAQVNLQDLTDATATISDYSTAVERAFERLKHSTTILEQRTDYLEQMQTALTEQMNRELDKLPAIESNIKTQAEDIKSRADTVKATMTAREEEINKLAVSLGGKGLAVGHKAAADRALRAGRLWHTLAIASILGLIGFVVYEFVPTLEKADPHWTQIISRVAMSLTIGVLITYAAKQARRCQEIFERNQNTALELAAIEPFIANLPIEKQHELKLSIGERTFAKKESQLTQDTPLIDFTKTKEFADLVLGIVKAANGK